MLYPNRTNGLGCTVLWIWSSFCLWIIYTVVSFPYFLWMDAYCGIAVDAFWQQAARRQLTAELSAGTDTKLTISLVEDEL